MAPSFLRGLLETKANAKPAEAIARATGSSPGAAYSTGLGPVGVWDIDYAVRNGLEKVIWVFRCIDVIAQNQAGLQIQLKRGVDRRQGKVIQDDRLWKLLNFRSNSYERSWQFRYRLSAVLLLARRGAFIEVINGQDGRPSELHILPPGVTEPIPDKKKFVSGYRVTRGDYQIDELKPEQVLWLKLKPHPTDPYAQMTPLMAAGIDCDTDFLARLFNRNFLANDGRPGMLITIDGGPGGVNPDDAEVIKSRFGGGPYRAGQTTVIEAMNMNVQDLGANPRDVQWGDLLVTSKERLLMAFGVPESVMGNASGRTFDNADAERTNFWLDTMTTHCDNIAAGFDPLSGDINDDTVFGYDYETVDVLQLLLQKKREEWRTEFSAGLCTLEEYQRRCGFRVTDSPAARAYFLTNGVAIAANPEEQALVDKWKTIGLQAQANIQQQQAAAQAGATQGAATGMRHLNNIVAARALQVGQKNQPLALETKDVLTTADGTEFTILADGTIKVKRQSQSDNREGISIEPAPGVPNTAEKVIIGEVLEKAHPYLGLRHRFEGEVEGALSAWDRMQEKIVCDRLVHVKSRKGTRHWEGSDGEVHVITELKAIDPAYSVEIGRWVDDLTALMEATVRRAVKQEIGSAANDLMTNGILDLLTSEGKAKSKGTPAARLLGMTRDAAADDVVGPIIDIIREAGKNQSQRLADTIKEMDDQGASIKQIESAIRRSVGTRSPWRKQLATNVVTTAIEGARAMVYAKAGNYVTKTWNTVGDERVRSAHHKADGMERPNGKVFRVGRSYLQYPGDPAGAPEDVINCRCFLEWHANFDALGK